MLKPDTLCDKEKMLAASMQPVLTELRMLSPLDWATIEKSPEALVDVIGASMEMNFAEAFVTHAQVSSVSAEWNGVPSVTLDLTIHFKSERFFSKVQIFAERFSFEIQYAHCQKQLH